MPYLQLTLPCTEAQQPRVERALEDVGALAVTLQDAHLDAADEQAIFEPGVGEIPLWDEMTLTALFPDETDALVLLAALDAFDPGLDWTRARFDKVVVLGRDTVDIPCVIRQIRPLDIKAVRQAERDMRRVAQPSGT